MLHVLHSCAAFRRFYSTDARSVSEEMRYVALLNGSREKMRPRSTSKNYNVVTTVGLGFKQRKSGRHVTRIICENPRRESMKFGSH